MKTYEEVNEEYKKLMEEGKVMSAEEWMEVEEHITTEEEEKMYWDSMPDELKKIMPNPYEKERRENTAH